MKLVRCLMLKHKTLKFFVDIGVGKKVEQWLIEQGYDVKTVRDIGSRTSDREILRMAVSEKRMVITMDQDFGELVYNSKLPHKGVLLLRLEDAKSDEKVRTVKNILEEYSDKLLDGFCVFKDGKLRIRSNHQRKGQLEK